MKNMMDKDKELTKRNMEKMEQNIMESLIGKLPKIYKVFEGTHENKCSIQVEQHIDNKQFSSGFRSNSGVNYGRGPKFNFLNIELNKFDGTEVFT
jgi:hypothetical protein